MKGYRTNIAQETKENAHFRRVLYTGKNSQLVLMSLLPGEEIGLETHTENDQFFRFESGMGKVHIDNTEHAVGEGISVIIPAGAKHNVINIGLVDLKMYTLYSPPHHKDGIVRATKREAVLHDEEFDGVTSE